LEKVSLTCFVNTYSKSITCYSMHSYTSLPRQSQHSYTTKIYTSQISTITTSIGRNATNTTCILHKHSYSTATTVILKQTCFEAQLLLYHIVQWNYIIIRIMKVRGFWPQIITPKPARYLLSASLGALVRHSQAQKCLQIHSTK